MPTVSKNPTPVKPGPTTTEYPLSEYHRELRLKMLYLVNQDRMNRGMDPIKDFPQGRPQKVNHCVLARARGGRYQFMFMDRVRALYGQTGVSFVNAFDRGVYKDLIE